jgi:flavoprotein
VTDGALIIKEILILVYCTEGTVFLKSVDATDHYKSANYICGLIEEVIEKVGATRVVQVVSDNGANFKKAGSLLMDHYSHIFWTPCAAHCIDLMLEDIGNTDEIKDVVKKAQNLQIIYIIISGFNLMQWGQTHGVARARITRCNKFHYFTKIYTFKDDLK